jgi:hypothetical protein
MVRRGRNPFGDGERLRKRPTNFKKGFRGLGIWRRARVNGQVIFAKIYGEPFLKSPALA